MQTTITPNAPSAANEQSAVVSDESIAAKMAAMRELTMRNQIGATSEPATGTEESADDSRPVTPEGSEDETVIDNGDASDAVEPEAQTETVSPEEADSTSEDLIDFIEFAETNPNAKLSLPEMVKKL